MAIDPYLGPYAYDGPWPPDPSWDDPLQPVLPESPVPDVAITAPVPGEEAPEAAAARAAADAVFAEPAQATLSQPRAVDAPVLDAGVDESLIGAYEEPVEGDTSLVDTSHGLVETTQGVPEFDEAEFQAAMTAPEPNKLTAPGALEAQADAEEQARIAALSPEDLALEQFQADQAADAQAGEQRFAALEARHAEQRRAEDAYRAAMKAAADERAQIDAEAARLANEKVDPDGWRSSRTMFQTIAMYVAGIVGGLMQTKNGGVNRGLEMIDNEIARHIAAQRENIAHRRAMLGERRAALGEDVAQVEADRRTEEAFILAAYQRALEEAEAAKQQFDPKGTRARQYEVFQREMAARAAQARDAAVRDAEDRYMKVAEHAMKAEKHAADLAKTAAETAKLKGAGGGAGGGSAGKVKRTASEWNKMFPGANVPDDGTPLTIAEYRTRGETGKSLTAPTEAEKEIRDLAIGDPRKKGESLKRADGSVFIPPAHAAPALQKQMAAATQVVNIIDEIDAIRDRVGGESSWGNSDEYQRVKALQNQLVILQKGGTEGMSSDEDMKKLAAAVGASDPASFRSQAAGLKQGRINTVNQLNAALRAAKYDGDSVKFPNLHAKAKQTPDQRELAKIKALTTGEKGQSIPTAAVLTPVGAAARLIETAVRDEDPNASLPADDRAQIDSWAKAARGGDATARASIEDLARENTRSPAVRKYAAGLLADIQAHEFTKATGKKPGDKGFTEALRKYVGYTFEEPEADDNADEEGDE